VFHIRVGKVARYCIGSAGNDIAPEVEHEPLVCSEFRQRAGEQAQLIGMRGYRHRRACDNRRVRRSKRFGGKRNARVQRDGHERA